MLCLDLLDAVHGDPNQIVCARLVLLCHLGQVDLYEHLVAFSAESTQVQVCFIVLDEFFEFSLHVLVGAVRVDDALIVVLRALREVWCALVGTDTQH